MKTNIKIIIVLLIMAIVSLIFYLLFFNQSTSIEKLREQVHPTASLYLPAKDVGEALNFINDEQQITNLAEITKEKWSLLFFGYTSCPQICPMHMGKINASIKQMSSKDNLQVFFISVDPKRDIGVSDYYAKQFNDDFIGINMPINKMKEKEIGTTLGIYHEIMQTQKDAKMHNGEEDGHDSHAEKEHEHNYDINHTTSYVLLNPELQMVAILSSPNNPADMAKALDKIITSLD